MTRWEVIRKITEFIAEEMGVILRNTAYSPNIKERMDFSCAVLNDRGELVAQAEHIPVHLGSLAVGAIKILEFIEREGIELFEGDVLMVNDPYIAGTHLNDVTLMKPVYHGDLVGFVINKAHHVDIGGAYPGGISAAAEEDIQEGLVIPPVKIVKRGEMDAELVRLIRSNVRVPRYTIGDLKAQIASLNVGEKRVKELFNRFGKAVIDAWMYSIDHAERYLRKKLEGVEYRGKGEDYIELDDKLVNINVSVEIKGKIRVDFSGTHPQVDKPLNAVFGVTVASTSFAIKSVLDPEMPMNYGFFRVVEIRAPSGTVVNPVKPAPVSAGNVETSQRIVDAIFKALSDGFEIPAASSGTMCNVIFGGRGWAFYETIGGGSGGRPWEDGVDGVHTNMTNTMNTPVEVIENEYPIMVLEYSLRENSCGHGKFRGGLGIRRVYKVLEDSHLTVMADRVKIGPWGLKGGKNGKPAELYIIRDGNVIRLNGKCSVKVRRGDLVFICTPGGGGYGRPEERSRDLLVRDIEDEKISEDEASRVYGVPKR